MNEVNRVLGIATEDIPAWAIDVGFDPSLDVAAAADVSGFDDAAEVVAGAEDFDGIDAGAGADVDAAGFPPTPSDNKGDEVGPDPTPTSG